MAKKGFGLALVAGLGALAIASTSGSSGSRPAPRPPAPRPPSPGPDTLPGPDEEVPASILQRVASAVLSNDVATIRAEAQKLRAEGWTAQATSLDEFADELEAKTKAPPDKTPPPPKPTTTTPPRDLVRGMKGEDVREWQNQLRRDGYGNIVADADFGQLTFTATKEWQWERELTDDGIVGAKTRAKIGTVPTRSRAPAPPANQPSSAAPKPPAAPAPPPAATKPPAVASNVPTSATPAPPAPPKPPAVTNTSSPASQKPTAPGTVPAALANVTLRRSPAPEPVDERVKLWQAQLQKVGTRPSTVKNDGKFGANTEAQTRALQKLKGLPQNGIADPVTIAIAYGAPSPKVTAPPTTSPAATAVTPLDINIGSWRSVLKKGNKGNDVREWQQVLNRYGFVVNADGDFGPLTHTATVAWQTAYARFVDPSRKPLVPDGEVGKNTRDRLAELQLTPQIVAGEGLTSEPGTLLELPPAFSFAAPEVPVGNPTLVQLGELLVRNLEATDPGNEDRKLIAYFQHLHGLNPTGAYGASTAEALIPLGYVPPRPRYWPTKKVWRVKSRYQTALRQQALRDPDRSAEWLAAAASL